MNHQLKTEEDEEYPGGLALVALDPLSFPIQETFTRNKIQLSSFRAFRTFHYFITPPKPPME